MPKIHGILAQHIELLPRLHADLITRPESQQLLNSVISTDLEIADTIALSLQWKQVRLYYCHFSEAATVAALCGHCDNLATLDMSHCFRISSHEI